MNYSYYQIWNPSMQRLIKHKVDKSKFTHLRQMAKEQLAHLNTIDTEKKFRILTDNDKQLE